MCTKSQQVNLVLKSMPFVVINLLISQALYSQSALTGLGREIGDGDNQIISTPISIPQSP